MGHAQISWRKLLQVALKRRNSLPRKFPSIQYYVIYEVIYEVIVRKFDASLELFRRKISNNMENLIFHLADNLEVAFHFLWSIDHIDYVCMVGHINDPLPLTFISYWATGKDFYKI